MASISSDAPRVIKSVQRGTITGADGATATISSVDVNKSVIHNLGHTYPDTAVTISAAAIGASAVPGTRIRVALTNATTVTLHRPAVYDAGDNPTVGFQVVEYY